MSIKVKLKVYHFSLVGLSDAEGLEVELFDDSLVLRYGRFMKEMEDLQSIFRLLSELWFDGEQE